MAGQFEVAGPLALKTYSRAELVSSTADLTTAGGRVFRAAGGAAPRGDFSVSVEQLEREASGGLVAVASIRASLVPKAGTTGTVTMDVAFTATW
jgi:hypothetical protein